MSVLNSDFFLHHLPVGTLFIIIILILKVQNGEHVIFHNVWFIMIVYNVLTSCLHSSQLPGKWVIVSSFREGYQSWINCLSPHTSEDKFSNLLLQIQHPPNCKLFKLSRIRQWRGERAKLSLTTLQRLLLKLSLTDLDRAGAGRRESGQRSFVGCLNEILGRQEWSYVLLPSPVRSPTTPYLPSPNPHALGAEGNKNEGTTQLLVFYHVSEGMIQMSSVS